MVIVGENPASRVYVNNKKKACAQCGIYSEEHALPGFCTEDQLLDLVRSLNDDPNIDGILVQLPLPDHINEAKVIETIDPAKDVDGFHPINVGNLMIGRPCLRPCTPAGVMELIKRAGVELKGKRATVVGRSNIVGKPVSLMLLAEHATVTICHSRTQDLPAVCREADVLVVAVGRPEMVRGDWIRPGAVVIDVGINRLPDKKLVGDVAFDEAVEVASAITPRSWRRRPHDHRHAHEQLPGRSLRVEGIGDMAMYDVMIVGAGPAGLSAAVNCRVRNKSTVVVSRKFESPSLSKAPLIENYLGVDAMSGRELYQRLLEHARRSGAEFLEANVTGIYDMGDSYAALTSAGDVSAVAVILATGTVQSASIPGESDKVGMGVSYCATCDGPLRKGKRVVVVGFSPHAVEEANFLSEICSEVTYVPASRGGSDVSHLKPAVNLAKGSVKSHPRRHGRIRR